MTRKDKVVEVEESEASVPIPRPDVPYWEDTVYRHLSRLHHEALVAGDSTEGTRTEALMQELVERTMSDERYWELDAEEREDRRRRKQERKQKGGRRPEGLTEKPGSVNVADLKKRVYNRHVSRGNVIKALEAMPAGEKKATIAGLSPGLKRKLGSYLKD